MSRWTLIVFISFLLLSFLTVVSDGKYVEGTLTTTSNWKFITRFCFMSKRGSLEYEFEYPESYMTQNLLLYWDAPGLWNSVYKSSLTCHRRQALLNPDRHQLIFMTPVDHRAGCTHISDGISSNGSVWCGARHTFQTIRDRWWYICMNNCLSKSGLKLKYRMWLRNGEPGDTFFEHFSADQFYILQTDISFFFLHVIILIITIIFAVILAKKRHFHTTYRLFVLSTCLQLLHVLFACILWGSYANTGVMLNGLRYFTDILSATSQVIFILMLLLMALGYTIVCGKLPTWLVVAIMIFIAILSVTYVALFIYEAYSFDPGWVLYRYESPSGYGLMALVILSWLIFAGSCVFTLATHRQKRAFYIRFLIFFSIWFWAVPTIVFISIRHIPPYMREKIVNGLNLSVTALSHLFYLWLTRPTEGNGNFPYHIRTEQIDVITLEGATEKALDEDNEFHDIGEGRRNTNFDIFTTTTNNNGAPVQQAPEAPRSEPSAAPAIPPPAFSQAHPARLPPLGRNGLDQPPPPSFLSMTEESEREDRGGGGGGGGGDEQLETNYVPRNLDSLFSFGPQHSQRPRELDM